MGFQKIQEYIVHNTTVQLYRFKFAFSLLPAYLGNRKTGTKIIEQYLNIKEVMTTYVSNF